MKYKTVEIEEEAIEKSKNDPNAFNRAAEDISLRTFKLSNLLKPFGYTLRMQDFKIKIVKIKK